MDFSIQTHSPENTQQIAACLVKHLEPPVTLALEGDLGAGKTCFVAGLVHALDPAQLVSSPTYALAHTYKTTPVVHHVDLYRVQNQDLEDLGIENLLDDPEAIVCVEWPAHRQNPLPDRTIQIYFEDIGEDKRQIKFLFSHHFSTDWVLTLRENLLSLFTNAG
ncbi:MAG: tRNA (adenosine(37)-N6)-threonylcarbamoyltransferase complex ATPase subunit type 1 TsaE [Myxococcaceae bacterium]